MSFKVEFELEGEKELEANLESWQDSFLSGLQGLIARFTEKIKREAEAEVPFDEGDLRGTIRSVLEQAAQYVIAGKVLAGGPDAPYALWVHEGTGEHARGGDGRKTPWVYFNEKTGQFVFTRGQKPNPFLERAWNRHIKDFEKELRKLIRKHT